MKTMKTFSSFFKTLTLILILLATSVSAWGSDSHFYLNGKTTKIENYYGQDSKYSIYVWMTTNSTFYLNNGSNNYGPNNNNTVINANTEGASGGYNNNKWKYTGATGLVRICVDQASNEWYPSIWVEEMGSILTGNDIMFYYGDTWGWGTKYLNKTNTNDYKNGNAGWKLSSTYCTVVRAAAGQKYWISDNSTWQGVQMSNNAAAGALYSLTNNNGNKINVTSGKIPEFSTTAYAITVGTATSGISATVNNTSSAGRANTLYYYYSTDGGNSWIGFDVNDVDELTEGEYQIAAISCDGFICVKSSNTATLTINPKTYSYTVTTAGEGGTVSPASGTVAQGSGVTITATPNDGYEFDKWTATNGTLANASNATTTFTPSANNANATASFKVAGCTQTPTTPTSLTAKVGDNALAGDVCSGTNVTLTAGGSISVGSLQWGTGTVGENIITAENGHSSITVSPIATTTYWVRSIITEAGVCYGATSSAKTLQITITPALVQPVLSKSTLTLEEGGSNGSITITSGTTGGRWTSSDLNVATVDNGTVTPKGPGTATITYTVSNACEADKTATCTVTVTAKPYYIGGRFQQKWNDGASTTNPFTYAGNGRYKLETGKTVAELSAQITESYGGRDQFFFIHTGKGKAGTSTYPFWTTKNEDGSGHNFEAHIGESNAIELGCQKSNWDQIVENRLIKFTDTSDKSSDVVIWWEPSTNKLWYTATELCKVTFSKGTGGKTVTAKVDGVAITSGDYVLKGKSVVFTQEANTGYTFSKWTNGSSTTLSTDPSYTCIVNEDVTVKAEFTEKTYIVTVTSSDINKGTVTPTTETEMSEVTGGAITATPKTGYHFTNWTIQSGSGSFTNANAASTRFKPTAVSTVQANFALNTYSVKFNANGGTAGTMDDQPFNYNEKKALSTNNFTREGHAFLGWSTTSDGEVEYGDEAEVTNLTTTNNATVNLYAKWQSQTPTYTINFEKQNGTNGTSSATVQYQNNNYSVNPVVAPTRTDYTFGGYYTQEEGAGVQVVSAAGEWLKSVTGYTDASGNWIKNSSVTTLYAKWISNGTATEGLPTDVYLVGEVFNNWSANENQEFKKATESSTTYSLVVTLAGEKEYKFKVIDNGDWRGNSLESEFLTETKTSVTLHKDGANNAECKITTTEAGEYIFTWNSETNTLSVEYPSDKVSLTFFGDGGTVGAVADDRVLTSPAKVKPGTSVTFTATPDANNAFSQWKKNGVVVSTDLTYTCTIDADATIEAVFLKPTTVFLKPNAQWKSAEARFAIYYWKSEQDNGWVDLEQLTCDDEYYTADVPVGYSQLQFVRMKPNSTNTQNNVWNRTTDLTLPTNGNNLYDLTKIYLKPNANWKLREARFAAYFFNDSNNEWMSMLNTDEDGVYYCDVPTAHLYNKVNFVRMPKDNSDNNWDINLNESKTIDLYNGSNYYTLEEERWGKNETGGNDDGMDIYYSGKWTKLELPTIIITNTTPDFGDVVVKTTTGRIITNGEKVPFDTKVIVTVTPKNGYKLQTATINGASLSVGTQNTICNNTTINVTFAIKEEWYVIGVDGDWETPQERFRFVDGQLEVELDSNVTANFKIAHMQGTSILTRYGNKSFSITERDQTLTSANGSGDHCNIATTYYGKYIFAWDAGLQKLTITYPLSVGDYRLAYQDSEDGSFHPERVIKKCIIGDRLDTVSFFVHRDKSPRLVLQRCATLVDGVGTWQTITDDIAFTVGKTGVWNFVLQQTNNPTHSVQVLTDDIKPYEGDYYIRTKSAKDGWTYFRSDSHKMTYSSYADNNEPFSHYFCKWVATDAEAANKTKNVRYTIANDYGDCISDTLAADPEDANPRIVIDADGDLPTDGANVRFGWDWETNEIRRAYIAGSTNATAETFLRLADAEELKNSSKNVVTGIKFEDLQNWIYQVDVIATKSTKVNLTALYADNLQYFKGGVDDNDKINLLASDAADMEFDIRLTYDFKTNHLIVAWLPGNTQAEGALGANMMVIREHGYENGKGTVAVTQLNLTSNLTKVDTVYAVMTFDKEWIEKTPRTRDQSIYWVSFPFDVKVSDIFGFGEYADAWILQYYDGAERAEKGLFIDSGTYWKYITDVNTTLKAGVGYVLVLDLNKVTFNHGVSSVSLYFPSGQSVNTISQNLSVDVLVPAHQCNIPYGTINHKITDSNWNLIGVPAFKDITVTDVNTTFNQVEANFYYEFLFSNAGYEVKSAAAPTDFKSMYGYMVQYAGTISWSAHSSIPEQLAARRNSESELPEKVVLGLELVQGEEKADQTFVQLQQEGATTDFDMNLDLTKIINSGANIYTLTNDRIQAAGNALPMEEALVPVGVQIAAEGEYTFRMPDGTEGMVVELVDYETNTRTNLLLSDYIVTLPKGTSENRFALHIQPQKDVVTSLENIGEGVNNGEAVNKYLIDGQLIIRTAEGVFDAQGKRL
ncbi:MAG: InlB B-repeat-containing protein [Paludibacteraceae bacterium]|nr:InlB B-repeat-containing protein [Paludibacteraceae bacterium]